MVIEREMNKLGEWAKGKPLGLVIFAQQAAVGVEPLFKWLKSIKAEDLSGNHITPPPSHPSPGQLRKAVSALDRSLNQSGIDMKGGKV
jgi:hypothetical protein